MKIGEFTSWTEMSMAWNYANVEGIGLETNLFFCIPKYAGYLSLASAYAKNLRPHVKSDYQGELRLVFQISPKANELPWNVKVWLPHAAFEIQKHIDELLPSNVSPAECRPLYILNPGSDPVIMITLVIRLLCSKRAGQSFPETAIRVYKHLLQHIGILRKEGESLKIHQQTLMISKDPYKAPVPLDKFLE